jgi:hypothetical protein
MASAPIDTATDALTRVTSFLTNGGEERLG